MNCSGVGVDGWDGWIRLGGSDETRYGVTLATTTGEMRGFAWGGDVIGWISFSNVDVPPPTDCGNNCPPPPPPYVVIIDTNTVTDSLNCDFSADPQHLEAVEPVAQAAV